MKLYSFGGVAFPTAFQDMDMPIEARSALVELPNGAFDMDGQSVYRRPAVITHRFPVDTSITSSTDDLFSRMVGSRGILKAVLRDGTTYRQTFAKMLSVRRPRQPFDKLVQQVELSFQQDYPYWLATADEPHYFDEGGVFDTSGWVFDGNYTTITVDADQETPSISNTGELPIPRGHLVIVPASGASFDSIKITNLTNMMELRYLGPVDYPKRLVIDLLSKRATLDMINTYGYVQLPQGQHDWLTLEVGTNSLQIDVTGRSGTTTIYYHWARHYA